MKTFSTLFPAVDRLKLAVCTMWAWALLLGSCSQSPVTVTLHSLQASGNVSFVCRGDDRSPAGHKLDECPESFKASRRLLGLVTQTTTNEVAVIDLYAGSVLDIDPSTPGFSFLRVGARPGAIVSTPGGAASFVGVSGVGKDGIFALPTTCLRSPDAGQAARDLTTWSACHLSSAPGDIKVLVDPPRPGASTPRASCTSLDVESAPRQDGRECPADLTREPGPQGRRKLLVALPEEHRLVLLDAQSLLDRNPGEFASCTEEASIPLQAELPSAPILPDLPVDLQAPQNPTLCPATSYPPPAAAEPTPGGFAVSGGTVYVADRTLPVVHVLDASDPCATHEQPPLLPYSYLTPDRVVTTSRVAVSPLTPSGKQFVYAIDETDPVAASVMAFDVSPVTNASSAMTHSRAPIVFPGAPRQPYLPPDRLRFSAPVRDLSFVERDFPASVLSTGVGEFGVSCDPYPDTNADPTRPGAQYRPSTDLTEGARPLNLRGVFGFAMLTNGQIAVIDVEDFDAPCRRPLASNPTPFEDFRGCVSDPGSLPGTAPPAYFTSTGDLNGFPTVTNESSCKVVETHRPRSASFSISNSTVGLRSPSLRSFPQFSNPDPASMITVAEQPRLLAVNFPNPDPTQPTPIPAQVNVSAQEYASCDALGSAPPCDGSSQALDLDPRTAAQNSLTLPLAEPRSYAQDESPSVTFEGKVFPDRNSGFLSLSKDGDSVLPVAEIDDPDASFCSAGVEDMSAMKSEADSLGIPSSRRDDWASAHADYVQITGDFPATDDVYWRLGQGQYCADLLTNGRAESRLGGDRDACTTAFGNIDNLAVLKESRDLSIIDALSSKLTVKPRNCGSDCALKLQQLACCFPAGTPYTVRASHQWILSASAGLHDIAANVSNQCQHTASCDPRKKYFRSRAFEVCDPTLAFDPTLDTDGPCSIDNPNIGCVAGTLATGSAEFPIQPAGTAHQCIFENLTSRFVVYRGRQPSSRGMSFSWQSTGGFVPLSMSLATQSNAVNPQSLNYLAELDYLAVVDGATLGLSLFDLNSLGVAPPSPFY